jgi:hypothetical protein
MNAVEQFGKIMVKTIRDRSILHTIEFLNAQLRSPSVIELQKKLSQFSAEEKNIVLRTLILVTDSCLHDLLCRIQESHDLKEGMEIFMNTCNVANASGMLHGELFGEDGWIDRFSQYPWCEDVIQ